MKKPDHDYYDILELIERWRLKYKEKIKIKDLLKWGASGRLQFSIYVTIVDSFWFSHFEIMPFSISKDEVEDVNQEYMRSPWKECHCAPTEIYPSEKRLYRVEKRSIDDLLSPREKERIQPILLMNCNDCSEFEQCKNSNTLDYSAQLLIHETSHFVKKHKYVDEIHAFHITKDNLVVTHDDLIRFEKESFIHKESTPPYLDQENKFYSVTLDLAVRTWRAIFIDKKHLEQNSAANAGKKYLLSPDSGCAELLEKIDMKLSDTLVSKIAKIAAGEYSPNKAKWNEFRLKK
jgi:hypothetical protein